MMTEKEINHTERAHHPEFPPSSLPAFAKCPCYKSKPAGPAAERGTKLHEQLEEILTNKEVSNAVLEIDHEQLSIKSKKFTI